MEQGYKFYHSKNRPFDGAITYASLGLSDLSFGMGDRAGSGNLNSGDKWNFCLTLA
jgi:hypothetical protein